MMTWQVALMEVQLGNVEKGTFLVESIVRRSMPPSLHRLHFLLLLCCCYQPTIDPQHEAAAVTVWCRNPDYNEMVLASAAIGWTLGRFAEGMDLYQVAVEKDPRLLDDRYLKVGEANNTHSLTHSLMGRKGEP